LSERLSPKAITEEYCGFAKALEAAMNAIIATSNLLIEIFIIPPCYWYVVKARLTILAAEVTSASVVLINS
jgi:hypothetical protein